MQSSVEREHPIPILQFVPDLFRFVQPLGPGCLELEAYCPIAAVPPDGLDSPQLPAAKSALLNPALARRRRRARVDTNSVRLHSCFHMLARWRAPPARTDPPPGCCAIPV